MDLKQIIALDKAHYMNTFGDRIPIVFRSGSACTLTDQDGKTYTDFLAGIATNALGYGDAGFVECIASQAMAIAHTSNYFYIEPQAQLAALLCTLSVADRVFFASTGAEANECAIKLARKYFYAQGIDRYEIISCDNSFHGRTLATLAATGQAQYRTPFAPIPGGFVNVPYCDIDAVKRAINDHTAAVLVEPIQGEGGVIEGGAAYLNELRDLCDAHGILLILDEVQTGMGRTGKLFAHQLYGIEPDIFTSAKALGNGLPIAACLCKEAVSAFVPGDHGTTLGGNPLCCAAALYTLRRISEPGFLDEVAIRGKHLKDELLALQKKHPEAIAAVRGAGLLLGVALNPPLAAAKVRLDMLERGFVIGTAGGNTLRFVPPLIITAAEVDALIQAIDDLLFSKKQ